MRKVTQLELENFGQGTAEAEEAGGEFSLSVEDARAKELSFRQLLIKNGKMTEKEDVPSWADIYQRLTEAHIRPRLALYIAWATMPARYRYPETLEKFATEVLGLSSPRAIFTWRKKFPEIDVMVSELQGEAMLEYRPGVFHALGQVASDPSYRANPDRRLFLEITKDYTPRQKIDTGEGTGVGRKLLSQLKTKSTAELIEMLGEEGLELVRELEEDLDAQEEAPLPSASPTLTGTSQMEEHNLEGEES